MTNHTPADLILLMIAGAFMAAAVVGCFRPRRYAPGMALAGLLCCCLTATYSPGWGTFVFWAAATGVALGINYMLPAKVSLSRAGVPYITGGSLAGAAVGMTANTMAGIIIGAAAGAFLGALAFARTARGKAMNFPSAQFFNYLGAKGLPTVVVMAMSALMLAKVLGTMTPGQTFSALP